MDDRTAILREWFDRVDSDRTGSITALQLKRALAVGNLDFAITVVEQMIRMYDFDRNGTMSFEEFVALNKFLLKVQHAFSDLERPWLKWVSHWTPRHFTLSVRALIKRRMADSGWMISYLSAYLCSLPVIYLIHLTLLSKGGWPSISINSSIALQIVAYEMYMNVRSRGLS